jgi:hypothetical protein
MSYIDEMAEAERRHKRDGYDLQWNTGHEAAQNWGPVTPITVVHGLILCERPSGANAEARHAAEQKSRDRVAAEMAKYQHADSIDDIQITRHIGIKQDFDDLMDEFDEAERNE